MVGGGIVLAETPQNVCFCAAIVFLQGEGDKRGSSLLWGGDTCVKSGLHITTVLGGEVNLDPPQRDHMVWSSMCYASCISTPNKHFAGFCPYMFVYFIHL